MKAGAFTPATPVHDVLSKLVLGTLNEGGGFHPRNPTYPAAMPIPPFHAQ